MKIQRGYWPVGSALPSRPRLAKEYGVGLPTLEQAITLLLKEGILHAELGRGTFVAQVPPAPPLATDPSLPVVVPAASQVSLAPRPSQTRPPLLGILAAQAPVSHDNQYPTDWGNRVVFALEAAFSRHYGATLFFHRFNGAEQTISLEDSVKQLLERGINALAVANVTDPPAVTASILPLVHSAHLPTVIFPWEQAKSSLPSVDYDQVYAGYQAAQHLLQAGYAPLVYLDLLDYWWSKERLSGAQMALREARLPLENHLLIYQAEEFPSTFTETDLHDPSFMEKFGAIIAPAILSRAHDLVQSHVSSTPITPGIIAPTDYIAHALLQSAELLGHEAGHDFGLVGFDDDLRSSTLGLTTLRPPLEEIGQEGARLLFQMLEGHTIPQHSHIRSHLVIRRSTYRSVHPRQRFPEGQHDAGTSS